MRKMSLSFQRCLVSTYLVVHQFFALNAQMPDAPVFGPVTFGTGLDLPTGWEVQDGYNDKNTWELINTVYLSSGYDSPRASNGSHIKIDATAAYTDYFTSPVIDCSNYTNGILKLGIWRYADYTKTLYVCFDLDGNNDFKEFKYEVPPDSIPKAETWRLVTINLKNLIDRQSKVRIRFSQSIYGKTIQTIGPLRIDDITLYARSNTQPTNHFRTRISGDWNNNETWESSPDSLSWIPASSTPTYLAASITIRNAHNIESTNELTVDNLTVSEGSTLNLAHDLSLNDGRGEDILVKEGGTLSLSTYHITGYGTIMLNGRLLTAFSEGLFGSDASSLSTGVILNTPGNNSIIEYNGMGLQSISSKINYANLAVSGSGDKVLTGPTIVSKNLIVDEGYLLLNEYDLIVGDMAIGSPSSYIKINNTGRLTISNIGTEAKIFPIGNSSYNPVTISSGSGLNWTVGIKDQCFYSDPALSTNNNRAVHRTWSITPAYNPPPLPANVLLEYNDSDPAQVGNGFNKDALVQVWRQAEEGWLGAGEPQAPSYSPDGTRTVSFSTDAPLSLFTISNLSTPLPVRFRDVNARQNGSAIIISFTNETESGVEEYTIERSADGMTYKPMHIIQPIKNNGTTVHYESKDAQPLEGINLYRIKGREKDNKLVYSIVVRVNTKGGEPRLTIVPNPAAKGDISIQLTNVPKGYYNLCLYDAKGQKLHRQSLPHAGGSASFPLNVERLRSGTYLLELNGKEKLLQRFVIL